MESRFGQDLFLLRIKNHQIRIPADLNIPFVFQSEQTGRCGAAKINPLIFRQQPLPDSLGIEGGENAFQ